MLAVIKAADHRNYTSDHTKQMQLFVLSLIQNYLNIIHKVAPNLPLPEMELLMLQICAQISPIKWPPLHQTKGGFDRLFSQI